MAALSEPVEHIDAHEGVWYATHAQVAEYVLQNA